MLRKISLDSKLSSLGVPMKSATIEFIYELLDQNWDQISEPTIEEVLSIDIEKKYYHHFGDQYLGAAFSKKGKSSLKTLHLIRTRLKEAGYTHKDGPYLYFATMEYYTDKVVSETKAYYQTAEMSVSIAAKMKWINVLD